MATLKVLNLNNEEQGSIELNDKIAQVPLHPFVVKDVVVQYLAQARQGTHKTKERSEVKGSRRKLFRQKGTGNARVGSAQSPIRRHGGTVFGPVPRDHGFSLNKKVKKLALTSVIGESLREDKLKVVDELKLESHKTKDLTSLLQAWNLDKVLFVYSVIDEKLELASRNLQNVKTVHSSALNVYDVLKYGNIVLSKAALMDVEGRLLK